MIDYSQLRQLVLGYFKDNPGTSYSQYLIGEIGKAAQAQGLFPTEEECKAKGSNYSYYRDGKLNPIDELNINQIVWDLIVERVVTPGKDRSNDEWPWLRLTKFGVQIVDEPSHFYDPDRYLEHIKSSIPELDGVIGQYVVEGMRCFRQRLYFAAAVMLGAGAEKLILLLLDSLKDAETNPKNKKQIEDLIERPRLPQIFDALQNRVTELIKAGAIPYNVHEGCLTHLLSLFEMVRVQRNDAVHPKSAEVNKERIFLTIQTFPAATKVTYRLIRWFRENKI